MMTKLCSEVLQRLQGKTLVTAESLTGGGIGSALTAVPGSSQVYKGGIISYTNEVKETVLQVPAEILEKYGAVSQWTAGYMARGARDLLKADVAIAVTGLAGPGGDDFGNPVGTVFIAYEDSKRTAVHRHVFAGSREEVRNQTIKEALQMILDYQNN